MSRAYLPYFLIPSPAARKLLGPDLAKVGSLALKAILRHRRSLEVAHQQIRYRGHHLAFSSRITGSGELVLELDIGDERLSQRLILEEDLRPALRRTSNGRGGRR